MITVTVEDKRLPPGSKAPQLWQNFQLYAKPYHYLDSLAKDYGETFTLHLEGNQSYPYVFFSNPKDIRAIFALESSQFVVENTLLRAMFGDGSLFLLEGEHHRRDRKLLLPSFHGEKIQALGHLICQVTEAVVSQIKVGDTFVAAEVARKIMLLVIAKAVFGERGSQLYEQLYPLFTKLMSSLTFPLDSTIYFEFFRVNLGTWSPWGRLQQCKHQIHKIIQTEIEKRRQQDKPTEQDILTLMLAARDERGQLINDEELRNELFTLLSTGFENAESAIAWGLYWLHKYPHVKAKLLQELDSLGEAPDPIAICRLPYLTAVCNETLRIYPVIKYATPRRITSSLEIGQYQFAVGTVLIPCIHLLHHRQDLYPQPYQFKPERFIEHKYDYSCEFIPFGGGNRRCLGYELVNMEMKLILATMVSRYEFQLASNKPVKPRRRSFAVIPGGGVNMVIKREFGS